MQMRLIYGCLAMIYSNIVLSQELIIADSLTRNIIPYVKVLQECNGKTISTETNHRGELSICQGRGELIISTEGYYDKKIRISLNMPDSILLAPKISHLGEIIVIGEKTVKKYKLGYPKGEHIRFQLDHQLEIGCYIPNNTIHDTLKLNKVMCRLANHKLKDTLLDLIFYSIENQKPREMLLSIENLVYEKNKNQINVDSSNVVFGRKGIFVSIKIVSQSKPFVKLTKQFYQSNTFIRGGKYGEEWVNIRRLGFPGAEYSNASISIEVSNE